MKNIKQILNRILPSYSYIPLIVMLVFNWLVYFGTRFFTTDMHHYSMYTPLDEMIPFVPAFISVYILAYVQWILGYGIIARENKEIFMRIVIAEMIAKAMALVCFIAIPTTIDRPEITGTGLWDTLTAYVYNSDAPDNLFPSVHCLESWVCFRGAMYLKKPGRWYKYASLVFTLLVFSSTVFVKQHVVLDMAGAVLFVEIGMFVSGALQKRRCADMKKEKIVS
ncbi:MAG: hypothetical protein ACI4JN_10885 [Ruminococcus sp.]